jgi:hypothetical protein
MRAVAPLKNKKTKEKGDLLSVFRPTLCTKFSSVHGCCMSHKYRPSEFDKDNNLSPPATILCVSASTGQIILKVFKATL